MGKLFIGDVEPSSLGALDKLYIGDELVWPSVVAFDHLTVVNESGQSYSANPLIEKPAVGAGRIAVLFNYSRNASSPAPTPGGTPLTNETNGGSRWVSHVILTDASWDGVSYFGSLLMNGNQFNRYQVIVFEAQGADNTPIPALGGTPSSISSIQTSSNPPAQIIDTTGYGKDAVALGFYSDPGTAIGWNESMKQNAVACEDGTGGSANAALVYKYRILKNLGEPNVTVDMDGPGTNTSLASFLVSIGVL